MIKTSTIGFGLVIAACLGFEPVSAQAQMGPSGSMIGNNGSAVPPAAMMMNPYFAMNPYLNPGMTQQPMNGTNALMYLYAANNANGGLGSGRISGTRGGAPVKAKVAEMPYTAHPGGGASRYFNPGPRATAGAGRYYSQRGRYFQNNGH